jgi:hypothetical protein
VLLTDESPIDISIVEWVGEEEEGVCEEEEGVWEEEEGGVCEEEEEGVCEGEEGVCEEGEEGVCEEGEEGVCEGEGEGEKVGVRDVSDSTLLQWVYNCGKTTCLDTHCPF